jgi:hypothetical protein
VEIAGGGIQGQIPAEGVFRVTAAQQRRGLIADGHAVDSTDVVSESDSGLVSCQANRHRFHRCAGLLFSLIA